MRTKEEQLAYMRSNPEQQEKKRQRSAARYQRNHSNRWRIFGGTLELFEKYWVKQKGRCGICSMKLKRRGQQGEQARLAQFDHCHDTLRPRGLLCMRCNVKLDWYIEFKEEIEDYLQ